MKSVLSLITLLALQLTASLGLAHEGHQNPLAGHLAFKNGTFHVHATFEKTPVVGAESILILSAKNGATHSPVAFADDVSVVLWMTSMGHGSAPTQVERVVDAAGNIVADQLRVRNVYFVMGGDWDIQVSLTDAQGVKETKSFTIVLGSPGHGGGHH